MPLSVSALAADLEAIAADPPPNATECAQAWADALGSYASGVTPPSASVSAAQATLATALAGAFASPAAAPLFETAMVAFAGTVALGMAPAFTGTPPAAPIGLAAQFAGPKPPTHAAAGAQLAALFDTWMRTGTAVPSAPGPPVPWS